MKTNLRNGVPLKTLRPREFNNHSCSSSETKELNEDWDIGEDVYLDERTTIKLKSVEELTTSEGPAYCELACHNSLQGTKKVQVLCSRCPNTFCGECLNQHGEKMWNETEEGVKWVCPKCRERCSSGCNNRCTCGPCRKNEGLAPVGQLLRIAAEVGYGNVRDYLVHFQKGDSPSKIAKRKEGRGWTKAGTPSTHGIGESVNEARVRPEDSTSRAPWKLPERIVERSEGRRSGISRGDTHLSVDMNKHVNVGRLKRSYQLEVEHSRKKVLDHILGRVGPDTTTELDPIAGRISQSEDPKVCKNNKESPGPIVSSVRQTSTRVVPRRFGEQEDDSKSSFTAYEENSVGKERRAFLNTSQKEKQLFTSKALENDGGRYKQALKNSTQLIKPITSLQTLRKMGILAKRDPPVHQTSEEPVQSKRPANSTFVSEHLEQSLESRSEVEHTHNLPPSKSPASQVISTASSQREKVVHSIPAEIGSEATALSHGGKMSANRAKLGDGHGFGRFGNKRSVTSFESRFEQFGRKGSLAGFGQRATLQSGFEHFCGPRTSSGFEAFGSAGRTGIDLFAFRK